MPTPNVSYVVYPWKTVKDAVNRIYAKYAHEHIEPGFDFVKIYHNGALPFAMIMVMSMECGYADGKVSEDLHIVINGYRQLGKENFIGNKVDTQA